MEERVCRPNHLHLGELRRTDELPMPSLQIEHEIQKAALPTHLDRHVDVLGFHTELLFGSLNGAVHLGRYPSMSARAELISNVRHALNRI